MADGQFDMEAFRQAKQHAMELEKSRRLLNKMYKGMDDLYWMRWAEESATSQQVHNPKITKTPRARNAQKGAQRLLTAADPEFTVPRDINDNEIVNVADDLERFAKAMWMASGFIQGNPVHYDVVHSALQYSEIHIAITSTAELLKAAKGASPARVARAEKVAAMTPYIFECWNPQAGYPEYGTLGLEAFYRKVKTTVGAVIDDYGEAGLASVKASDKTNINKDGKLNRYAEVTLNALWDLDEILIWLNESERPVKQEEHELPFIPIEAQIVEGSKLFDKPEEQHEPFLYTLQQSGLVNRQNLILTLFYSLAFGFANPMYVNYLLDPDNPPDVDWNVPGGQINMRAGERREPAIKQVIDPALMQAWQLATDLEMESTIYRQTLGEPLGANSPFSALALLSQSGRLPLTVPQRKSSWAIAAAVMKAFDWMRFNKSPKTYARFEDITAVLEGNQIPKHFTVNCKLEITLPQDKLNAANTSAVLTQGDDPLVSHAWVRENILSIGQSADMQREIWGERVSNLFAQQYFYKLLAQIAQLEQAAMQPGASGGIPGAPPTGVQAPPGQTSPEQAPPAPNPELAPPIQPEPPIAPTPERLA